MKNETREKILAKIEELLSKKDTLNLFCVWCDNCCNVEILRNNLKILNIPLMLKEFVKSNEDLPNLDVNLIASVKKTINRIEINEVS